MATSDYSTVIQQLYVAYFGRPADVIGLSSFKNALNAAGAPPTIAGLRAAYSTDPSVKALVDSFGNSAESLALYGTGSASSTVSFVNAIYINVLGRAADFDGLVFWSNAINSGVLTKGAASLAIMAGALVNVSEQGLIDAALVANKVTVATNFTAAIDTIEKLLAYDGDAAAVTARSMLATVTNTTDATAFQANITSTLSNLVTTHNTAVVVGSTFTLTTASDTLVGTAKDDTFNAGAGTFTSLDKLDGGVGNDVLNIISTSAFTVPLGVSVTNVETVNLTGASSVSIDTSTGSSSSASWAGLTALNVTNTAAADTVTAASTTAISVTNSLQAANVIKVDGGSSIAVTATGAKAGGDITIGSTAAAAGAVTVSSTAQAMTSGATGGAIAVTGGTTISITSITTAAGVSANGTETAVQGNIVVTGNANTTTVSVIQSGRAIASTALPAVANTNNAVAAVKGITNGTVTIADANASSTTQAGTITAVTLQNYADSSIAANQLTTLTLSGTGVNTAGVVDMAHRTGTLNLIDNLTTQTITALTLNLGGGYLGTISSKNDAGVVVSKFATVNAVMTADTILDGLSDSAFKTLAISGTGMLRLDNIDSNNTGLTSVTVSGAAGFNGDLSKAIRITSFSSENATGSNVVRLSATIQTYTGGSGNDRVIITKDATKTIKGGDGTDTLILYGFDGATGESFTAANTGANVTGFEILQSSYLTGVVDVSAIGGSAFTKIQVAGTFSFFSDSLTFSKVTAGTTLELLGPTLGPVIYQTSDRTGADGTVTVMLTGNTPMSNDFLFTTLGAGTVGYTTTALTLQDADAVGIGSVNIMTDATVGGGLYTITTLTDSALKNLAITGTGALAITNLTTSATSFNLSDNNTSTGLSKIVNFAAVNLADLSYSGTHAFGITNLVNFATNVTITNANTGSMGVLTISVFNLVSTTSLTLNGAVRITNGMLFNGNLTVFGATDDQNVRLVGLVNNTGVKTITLGNGNNIITTGTGNDLITLGSGANNVTGGAGGDTITFAAHTGLNTVKYTAIGQTATGAVVSGTTELTVANGYDIYTGLQARDKIDLTGLLTASAASEGRAYNAAATAISTNIITVAGTNGDIAIVRGNYATSTGIFTTSSTGADSIVQWDSNAASSGGNIETIVLIGFVNSASTATSAGLITLA